MEKEKYNRIRSRNIEINKDEKPNLFVKGTPDIWFIILVVLMATFGIIMLFSASSPIALSEFGDSFYYLSKQLKSTAVGLVLCLVFASIDYRIFDNKFFRSVFLLGALASPILVYFLGYESNFAKRWIMIGGFSVQPSEFVKVFMILYLSSYYSKIIKEGEIDNFKKSVFFPVATVLAISGLIFKIENHFSSAMVISFISLGIIFASGIKFRYIIYLAFFALAGIYALFNLKFKTGQAGFRGSRVKTFLDPWSDPQGKGYQITQSLIAIGSGGWFGKGIGQSIQKKKYLPYAQNDFIFAIIVEEIGLVGAVAVIIAFFLLIFLIWRIAMNSKDIFGKLIAVGFTAFFTIQIFVNIAVAIGLIPVTGMSLPFFSSGGTSIMVTYLAIGILISISRVNNSIEEKK